ncbi:MAG TPA: methyl-accepting chemotaxis protein [Aromatoleum sp.]|uniref:methyl-accepting chemotaxis protein n=1 Tax=Aromatoleum sp. TaxID=2307007 RepID=UPI002B4997FA|nr:methyl-accepting chemotaxis protein [Aromatoleum sp.]HJV28031.1 methyl-accepting chemotaxis protein [Aromatoleum sp.]
MNTKSISFRISAVFLVVVSLLLLVFGAINYKLTRDTLVTDLDGQVDTVMGRLGYSLPAAVWNFDKPLVTKIQEAEMAAEFVRGIALKTDAEGTLGLVRDGAGKLVPGDKPQAGFDAVREETLYFEEHGKKTEVGRLSIYVSYANVEKALQREIYLLGIQILVLDLVLVLALSATLRLLVLRPLRAVSDALREIARGNADLTRRLDEARQDEIGEVAHWFNVFVEHIQSVIRQVRTGASELAVAAEQTSRTTEESNQAACAQRDQVGEVTQTVETFADHARNISRSTVEASEATASAQAEAGKGHDVVLQAVHSMEALLHEVDNVGGVIQELTRDSDKIAAVLGVIKEIAGQTNLLALNAAIEAARAGEAGRGFAVVADEVRKLATRTHESTVEVGNVIAQLRAGVEKAEHAMEQGKKTASEAGRQAQDAGQAIYTIASAFERIGAVNRDIADSAARQETMVENISRNIQRINDVASDTAAASDQTAQASESLARLAEQLNGVVDRFHV